MLSTSEVKEREKGDRHNRQRAYGQAWTSSFETASLGWTLLSKFSGQPLKLALYVKPITFRPLKSGLVLGDTHLSKPSVKPESLFLFYSNTEFPVPRLNSPDTVVVVRCGGIFQECLTSLDYSEYNVHTPTDEYTNFKEIWLLGLLTVSWDKSNMSWSQMVQPCS